MKLALIFFLVCLSLNLRAEEIAVPGGRIDLQFSGQPSERLQMVVRRWMDRAVVAVSTYYGRFPVRELTLRVSLRAGTTAENGTTYGWRGALITISVGRDATDASLSDDWLLIHEMTHLALPSVPDQQHWLEEGLASYIEPIARVQAGQLTAARIWRDFAEGMPQGQPESGDRGLDHTHTWGRTYWGGAMFCLRADVEIRRRTNNQRGLQHAVRAIQAAGGSILDSWDLDRVISVGDAATGVPVLRELYDQMKDSPAPMDLADLWQELGVVRKGDSVVLDDSAPLAAARRAITDPSK